MKPSPGRQPIYPAWFALARGRGLKQALGISANALSYVRPRKRAWIETKTFKADNPELAAFALARGRGLKRRGTCHDRHAAGFALARGRGLKPCLTAKSSATMTFALARGRGLKQQHDYPVHSNHPFALARGRGLKQLRHGSSQLRYPFALARGRGLKRNTCQTKLFAINVRPRKRAWIETTDHAQHAKTAGRSPSQEGVD